MSITIDDHKIYKVSRRDFIKSASVGVSGLLLGVAFSCTDNKKLLTGDPSSRFNPNVFIKPTNPK